jgi:hypothetical protein
MACGTVRLANELANNSGSLETMQNSQFIAGGMTGTPHSERPDGLPKQRENAPERGEKNRDVSRAADCTHLDLYGAFVV